MTVGILATNNTPVLDIPGTILRLFYVDFWLDFVTLPEGIEPSLSTNTAPVLSSYICDSILAANNVRTNLDIPCIILRLI